MSNHTTNYLYGTGGTDTDSAIVRTDRRLVEGNTYEFEFQTDSSGQPDNGFLFGVQNSGVSSGSYSGYHFISAEGRGQTEIQRWDSYSPSGGGSTETLTTGSTWPQGEVLTAEIDYRDSTSDIICRVYDSSDTEVVSISTSDSTYGDGYFGFYHWRDDPFEVYTVKDATTTVTTGSVSCSLSNDFLGEGGSVDFSATIENHTDSSVGFDSELTFDGTVVDSSHSLTDYSVSANDTFSHSGTVDHADFSSGGDYNWTYTVNFDDGTTATDSGTLTVESTGTTIPMAINHGDGNGEQDVADLPDFTALHVNHGDGNGEQTVFDKSN